MKDPDETQTLRQHSARLDSFTIHEVDPDNADYAIDVEDIAKAFNDEYGKLYFDVFLDTEKLDKLIRKKDTYTFVARADNADFVGTGSLIVKGKRAELGRVVVPEEARRDKRFKKRRVYDELIEKRNELTLDLKIDVIYTAAVTWHGGSQAGLQKRGFEPVAFQDAKYIPITAEEQGVGRESTILMLYRLSDFSVDQQVVYVHEELKGPVEQTLAQLKLPLKQFPVLYFQQRPDLDRKVDTKTPGFSRKIKVKQYSLDAGENKHVSYTAIPVSDRNASGNVVDLYEFPDQVHKTMDEHGLLYAEVEVACNNATSKAVYECLHERGFKFAGFLPGWIRNKSKHDAILMTHSKQPQQNRKKIDATLEGHRVVSDYYDLNS